MYFRQVVLLSFHIKCVFSFLFFFFFFCLLAFLCNDITSQFLGYYATYIFCTQLISICYGQKIKT